MAQQRQVLQAAVGRVDGFADYDDEFNVRQKIIADETFGTIAHCLRELDISHRHGADLHGEVEHRADTAADELQAALEARAEQVREEVEG